MSIFYNKLKNNCNDAKKFLFNNLNLFFVRMCKGNTSVVINKQHYNNKMNLIIENVNCHICTNVHNPIISSQKIFVAL